MKGKVALVTGAGSGLGRAITVVFTERGAKVVVADVNEEGGNETAELVKQAGGEATFVRTDVSLEAEVAALVGAAVEVYGRLDFAVNNAGIDGHIGPLVEQTEEVWQKVIGVNLSGVFFGLKHQIPAMVRQGGGSIVNVSSIAGLRGHPELGPYCASKHGVNGLTKAAAIEYGSAGVRVNSLCPGGIRTPMLDAYFEQHPHLKDAIIGGNPMRRMGEADEMAEVAVWLCSDAASYVNGHELTVDGGKIASDV